MSALADAAEGYRLAREALAHASRRCDENRNPAEIPMLEKQLRACTVALTEATIALRAAAATCDACD